MVSDTCRPWPMVIDHDEIVMSRQFLTFQNSIIDSVCIIFHDSNCGNWLQVCATRKWLPVFATRGHKKCLMPQEVLSSPQLTLGEGSVHCVVTRNKKIHIFWDESEIHQIKPNETEYILLTLGEGFMHINSESMLYIQHNYGRPRQWIWRHPPGGLTNGQITLLMRMWECALGYWENTDTKVLKEYTVCSLKCCNIQKCPFNGNIDNLKQGPWCLFI